MPNLGFMYPARFSLRYREGVGKQREPLVAVGRASVDGSWVHISYEADGEWHHMTYPAESVNWIEWLA